MSLWTLPLPEPRFGAIPIIYDKDVPKGMAYFINKNMLVIGTWRKLPSVASIIASQRRRRRK